MSPEDAQQLAGTPHNRGGGRVDHRWGRTKRKIGFLTVAAHHDLDRGPVATDATDDVTQDLLDFLARWPLTGAQQRQHGPAGRGLEDLDRLEAVAAGMGVSRM